MSRCTNMSIGVEIVKFACIFSGIMVIALVGRIAHILVSMQWRGGVQPNLYQNRGRRNRNDHNNSYWIIDCWVDTRIFTRQFCDIHVI